MSIRVTIDGTTVFDDAVPELALSELSSTNTLNAIGSAKLGFPNTHFQRSSLNELIVPYHSLVSIERDDIEIFRGRTLLPSSDFYRTLVCPCESELAFFCDSAVAPGTYTGTPSALFGALIANHNAQVDTFKRFSAGSVTVSGSSQSFTVKEPCSSLAYLNDLIAAFGGCIKFSWVSSTRTISWLSSLGDNEQQIKFGVNLLDLSVGYSQSEIVTRVVPYGKAVDGVRLTLPSPGYVDDQTAQATFGVISKAVVFPDAEDTTALAAAGNAYLTEHSSLISSLTLRAVDLSVEAYAYSESFQYVSTWEVGKTLQVISAPHGINGRWQLVQRYYDLLRPSNDRITLGSLPETLTGTYI